MWNSLMPPAPTMPALVFTLLVTINLIDLGS